MASAAQLDTLIVFAGLAAVLLTASAVGLVLQRRFGANISQSVLCNLNSRIKAWWVMIGLMGLAIWAGPLMITGVFCLVSAIALREFFSLIPARRTDDVARWACFLVFLPLQYTLIALGAYGMFTLLIPVLGLIALPVLGVLSGDTRHFLRRAAERQWGLMVCVFCISHVPALMLLDIPGYDGRNALLLIFLLLVVQASDVLQFICGKLIGEHRIAPGVSPSKTVEGLIGGVLLATLLGAALWRMTPFSPLAALGMAFTATVTGFLGGLVLSAVKRDRGIKDWGSLISGHGGVLDRLDSICFSAPAFFHLTKFFYGA